IGPAGSLITASTTRPAQHAYLPGRHDITGQAYYDNADRFYSYSSYRTSTWTALPNAWFIYYLDQAGGRLQLNGGPGATTYGYDNLNQLTSVAYPGGPTDTYTYDNLGNRLTKNAATYAYDDASQMTNAAGTAY